MPHTTETADIRSVYLVGICGTAMASLAGMLHERGYDVRGSDEHVYPPMSTYLARLGIPVLEGYTNEHLRTLRPDLVVIGNAIPRTNSEAIEVLDADLAYLSMPEAVYSLFIRGRHSVVVAGTHGKTTTTSLLAWVLESAGRDPGMMVGGIPLNFDRNYKLGGGEHFVIEGDEYNTAFFDKGPKFLHYRANTLIVNNIEFDHADIFPDIDAIVSAFGEVIERVEPGDTIIANGDDPLVGRLAPLSRANWITFGESAGNWIGVNEVELIPEGSRFGLLRDGRPWLRVSSPLSGRHNVLNAAAVFAAANNLGLKDEEIAEGLRTFQGIKRRMEVRGVEKGVTVIDDFAHHPTAVGTTLEGARARYPGARIWALFEPRSISSGRKEFEAQYRAALARADRVIIGPIFHQKRYETIYGIDRMMSVEDLVEGLAQLGVEAFAIPDFDDIAALVADEADPGDVVIAMSSGAFGGVHEKILERLRTRR